SYQRVRARARRAELVSSDHYLPWTDTLAAGSGTHDPSVAATVPQCARRIVYGAGVHRLSRLQTRLDLARFARCTLDLGCLRFVRDDAVQGLDANAQLSSRAHGEDRGLARRLVHDAHARALRGRDAPAAFDVSHRAPPAEHRARLRHGVHVRLLCG